MANRIEPNLKSIVQHVFYEHLPPLVETWAIEMLKPQEQELTMAVTLNLDRTQEELRAYLILLTEPMIFRQIDLATATEQAIEDKEKELSLIPF